MKFLLGIFDLIFSVSLFFILIGSYYLGVKHGMKLKKGEIPVINPVTNLKDYVFRREQGKITDEAKKEADKIQEGWFGEEGIMNYNPYNTKKEGE